MLAAAGLGEESLVRTWVANVLDVRVRTTVGAEAMLEEVAIVALACLFSPEILFGGGEGIGRFKTYSSQAELPSWVPAWPKCR